MASEERSVNQAELWDELYPILHEGCQYSPLHRSLARIIRHELAKLRFSTLLDVGCGNGSKLAMLNLPPSCQVVGVDISEGALSLARSTVETAAFQLLDIEKEPHAGRFDVVICSEVLEHLDSDVDALENIREACGGSFIITVPAKPLDPIGRQVGHIRHYTKRELHDKLTGAGFEVVQMRSWGFPFHTLYRIILNRFSDSARLNLGGGSKIGPLRRLILWLLSQSFKLNVLPLGREIIAVARPASGQAGNG